MDNAANRTIAHLQSEAAKLVIKSLEVQNGHVEAESQWRIWEVTSYPRHTLPTRVVARDSARQRW